MFISSLPSVDRPIQESVCVLASDKLIGPLPNDPEVVLDEIDKVRQSIVAKMKAHATRVNADAILGMSFPLTPMPDGHLLVSVIGNAVRFRPHGKRRD